MTLELDEILYNALVADATLTSYIGGQDRITSTCFEVSPDEKDNTPVPCIIVTDDGFHATDTNKDVEWEPSEDNVQASVEVDAESPKEVKKIIRMVRRAIAVHINTLASQGKDIPHLVNVQTNGVAWDWMKPCYHETISYQCKVFNDYDDEQD